MLIFWHNSRILKYLHQSITIGKPKSVFFFCSFFYLFCITNYNFSTRWHTNRFIRGAYSYISTDCDKNGTSSQLLAEPITLKDWRTDDKDFTIQFAHELINIQTLTRNEINNFTNINHTSTAARQLIDLELPILLFAGEACHEKYFSTAHGAFLSGMEQAEKILEFYNKLIHF